MKRSRKYDSEFGNLPEEYPVLRETDEPLYSEEFSRPTESDCAAEYSDPAPEYTEPGNYPYTGKESGRKQKVRRLMLLMSASVVLFLLPGSPLGTNAASQVPSGQKADSVESGAAEAELSAVSEETPAPIPAATAQAPTPTPSPTPSPTPTPVPIVYEEPACEIVAFNFSSEMHADMTFSSMADATKVTLEVFDPNTDYRDSVTDITKEAVEELEYRMEPFYTDGIYEANAAYYESSDVGFPMTVEIRVTVEYETADGPAEKVFSALTAAEPTGYFVKYVSDAEGSYDPVYAGTVAVIAEVTPQFPETEILAGEPEKVTGPGIISVTGVFDGQPIDASDFTIWYDEYDATFSGGEKAHLRIGNIMWKRPSSVTEQDGKEVTLYITHYLMSRKTAYTSEVKVPIRAHEESGE